MTDYTVLLLRIAVLNEYTEYSSIHGDELLEY